MRKNNYARARVMTVVASTSLVFTSVACGAFKLWTNATGNGLWNDPGNWLGGVPTAADQVSIGMGGTITLPTGTPALAQSVSASSPSSPLVLQSGRLITDSVSGPPFGTPFTISSTLSAAGQSVNLSGVTVTGAIDDGAGGGTFDVALSFSVLRGIIRSGGTTFLNGAVIEEAGSVANARSVRVGNGATVNASAAFPGIDRLPDAGELDPGLSLRFNGGTTTTQESIGTVSISGNSLVDLRAAPAGALTLTGAALARQPGATLRLNLDPTARLILLQSPTGPGGSAATDREVLGWGAGTVNDGAMARLTFLTYDAGVDPTEPADDVGLRPLAWTTEHATSISAGGNVRVTGAQSLSVDATVRTLNLADAELQLDGAQLTINRGLLLQRAAAATGINGAGAVRFTGAATVWAGGAGQSFTVGVPVHADQLTKAGDGELVLTRPSLFDGALRVSGGTLTSRVDGGLGGGTVVVKSGAVRIESVSQSIHHLDLAAGPSPVFSSEAGVTLTLMGTSGLGGVRWEGDGTLHLPPGIETTSGVTVTGGEFRLDGRLRSEEGVFSAGVDMRAGRLTGVGRADGFIQASFGSGYVIAPGPGVGRLTTDRLIAGDQLLVERAPVFEFELNGAEPGVTHDQIRVLKATVLSTLLFDLSIGYPAAYGDSFTVIDNLFSGPIQGSMLNLPEGSVFSSRGHEFRITYVGGDGNDVVVTVVPEPASGAAWAWMFSALILRRRRPGL